MGMIGIDIGTTTISGIVAGKDDGKLTVSLTRPNDAVLPSPDGSSRLQDAERIVSVVQEILSELIVRGGSPDCIGITGQMHGMLYCDSSGMAVSPLYTWQDGRGNLQAKNGMSYAQELTAVAGCPMATGYGLTTHYYHLQNSLIPCKAVKLCTIGDYVVMRLTGRAEPLIEATNAASMGLFDLQNKQFDLTMAHKAGIHDAILPKLAPSYTIAGYFGDIVPVVVAVGDNQASFVGSVRNPYTDLLVNVGTGSQVSFWLEQYDPHSKTELRPAVGEGYLQVGCPLCGGRAYAVLESFLRAVVEMTGQPCQSLYPIMEKLAENRHGLTEPLTCNTCFSGTRSDPDCRGSITGISVGNLTPTHLTVSVLQGMVSELYDIYSMSAMKKRVMVGSGNGIRLNRELQRLLCEHFGMTLNIPTHSEEASFGAMLHAAVAAGVVENLQQAQQYIHYD